MDFSIATILALDGITNGAIYALLALATVLVFAVTRVIFIPQGEFVAFGALTMAGFQMGQAPRTILFLIALGVIALVLDLIDALRRQQPLRVFGPTLLRHNVPALLIGGGAWMLAQQPLPLLAQVLLTLAIVTPMGGLVYRLAYQSLADASVLVLLIVSVGVHFALQGLGLVFFGPEGSRNPSFWDASFSLGPVLLSGQTFIIWMVAVALIVMLWLFFGYSVYGKALRATAVNRLGARLMGISSTSAGRLSFTMAAFMGALSGLLISATTTINYDSGFLIGLKGFVGAVFAGLASYPGAAIGALLVGLLESFGSFWASAYKEVIVFTSILPVLLWRSWRDPHHEEH